MKVFKCIRKKLNTIEDAIGEFNISLVIAENFNIRIGD